jgi:Resolvase, N terminal domain
MDMPGSRRPVRLSQHKTPSFMLPAVPRSIPRRSAVLRRIGLKLAKLRKRLEEGDVLVVTRLDRLARSTRDLLNILDTVAKAGAGFRSLADAWADTTTPHGRLMLTVLGGLAEFERELIRARTGEGRKRTQARGVKFGRPPKLTLTNARKLSHECVMVRRRLISRGPTGWMLQRLVAWTVYRPNSRSWRRVACRLMWVRRFCLTRRDASHT